MRWRMRTTRRDAHVKDDVPVGRRENFYGERRRRDAHVKDDVPVGRREIFYGERRKGTRRRPDEL